MATYKFLVGDSERRPLLDLDVEADSREDALSRAKRWCYITRRDLGADVYVMDEGEEAGK